MLPIYSNKLNFKNLDLKLSSNVLGKVININNNSNYLIDDELFFQILTINNIDFDSVFDKSEKIFKVLNFENKNTDISSLVPRKIIKESIDKFNKITELEMSSYYFDVLLKRNKLTSRIKSSEYDHHSSLTGRMKITNGKNYLVMKKSKRSEEIKKENILLELDIKSCEPALLHAVLYEETPEDIYSFFTEDFRDISRDKIKIAVISSIYGSEPKRVKRVSGLSLGQIKKIHEHFQLKKIKEHINKSYNEKGYFLNLYGRPIYDNSSPVNYWVQSSAADYSCLAFLNFLERTDFKLCACIHDAIIIDLNHSQLSSIKKVKKIHDPISNIKLRIEQTIIE